jgi:hypothetical protein
VGKVKWEKVETWPEGREAEDRGVASGGDSGEKSGGKQREIGEKGGATPGEFEQCRGSGEQITSVLKLGITMV